jgi:hypothetical protein
VDNAPQKNDIATRAYWYVDVRDGACAGKTRIDMNNRRAPLLGLHHPAESHRMAFGHVGAFNNDAIGVLQILLERRRAAPAERCPQTGDGGGVSNTGLIFDLNYPHGRK